jgi:nitrite reductase/ring-hydroxylating ferredoxin subunit
MEGGSLFTDVVACPKHQYTYDAHTGENRYPKNVFPAHRAKALTGITIYAAREHDGWVWVALE